MSANSFGFDQPRGGVAVRPRPAAPAPDLTGAPPPPAPDLTWAPPPPPAPDRTPAAGLAAPAAPAAERPSGRAVRGLRTVRAFVLSALLGAVVATLLVFLASMPLGFRSLTVMSGSMEPTLGVGDVVIERQVAPLDVRVGDIVTFRDPNEQSTLITHRVRSVKVHDGTVDVVTKGDANNTVEHWSIPVDGQLGLVVVHVPKIGYALVWASGRTGRIALIAIPGVALGIIELLRIWRPRRDEE